MKFLHSSKMPILQLSLSLDIQYLCELNYSCTIYVQSFTFNDIKLSQFNKWQFFGYFAILCILGPKFVKSVEKIYLY